MLPQGEPALNLWSAYGARHCYAVYIISLLWYLSPNYIPLLSYSYYWDSSIFQVTQMGNSRLLSPSLTFHIVIKLITNLPNHVYYWILLLGRLLSPCT